METSELIALEPKFQCAVKFFVSGLAQTAGSKRSFVPTNRNTGQPYRRPGGGVVVSTVDDNPKSKDWKAIVGLTARGVWSGRPLLDGPVELRLTFVRPRPRSHYRTGKNANILRDDAPRLPISKPDVLKLARAVEDALTGAVWKDDSQIVSEILRKEYGDAPGVLIEVLVFDSLQSPANQGTANPVGV